MTREEQYKKFQLMCRMLEEYAILLDIPIRHGEAHRPKVLAEEYARTGVGILESKHRYSLAKDYCITTNRGRGIDWAKEYKIDYFLLGQFWEFIGGVWGGNFKKRYDPYHFEFAENPA